jgi:BirA family biotin operon repressor/biotin-[acetyl-CoA-carboxylase] ligase
MGRSWYSPAKVGLWFSLILRPEIPPVKASGLSICAGVALAQAIRELTNLKAQVKWPNDCIIDGKKVAGILLELSAELDKVDFVIVGIGVNVNQKKSDFPKLLLKIATSLRIEKGKEIERIKLLKLFLSKFEKIYLEFKKTGLSFLQDEVNQLSSLLGKNIAVKYGEKIIKGKAVRIDENGSLVLKTKTKEETISAGEVTIL